VAGDELGGIWLCYDTMRPPFNHLTVFSFVIPAASGKSLHAYGGYLLSTRRGATRSGEEKTGIDRAFGGTLTRSPGGNNTLGGSGLMPASPGSFSEQGSTHEAAGGFYDAVPPSPAGSTGSSVLVPPEGFMKTGASTRRGGPPKSAVVPSVAELGLNGTGLSAARTAELLSRPGMDGIEEDVGLARSCTAKITEPPIGRRPEPEPFGPGVTLPRKTVILEQYKQPPPHHFEAIEDRFDKNNLINPDRLYPASTWGSIAAKEHYGAAEGDHLGDMKAFHSRPHGNHTGHGDGTVTLQNYRTRWLRDPSDAARDLRYTTEVMRTTAQAVDPRFRQHCSRVLPGTTKGLEALRDKLMSSYGTEGLSLLLQRLPNSFILSQLRAIVGPDNGGLGLKMTVDEGKNIWRQSEAGELTPFTKEQFAATLIPSTLSPLRQDAITAAWTLVTALAKARGLRQDEITIGFLDRYCDYQLHNDVIARKATHGECRKRFIDGLNWVIQGEPAAPAPGESVSSTLSGTATLSATSSAASVTGSRAGSRHGSISSAQQPPASAPAAAARKASSDGEDDRAHNKDEVSKWDTSYIPPRLAATPVDEGAFRRYYALLSASIDDDSELVALLIATWHMEEAVNLVPPEEMPKAMRPLILAAVAKARGQQGPSEVLLKASEATKQEREAAEAEAAREAAEKSLGGAASTITLHRGRKVEDVYHTGVAHLLLLVTHSDGKRSLQRIACDRFLRKEDKSDLLARLAAAGIKDAVDATVDF
jgi:hypothetical protein